MEAILELVVAWIVQPIFLTMQFVTFLIGLVAEFAFTAIFKGITAAKSSASVKLRTQLEDRKHKQTNQSARRSSSLERWSVLAGCLIFISFVVFQVVNFRIQRQRVEITNTQVATVVEGIVSQELPKDGMTTNPRVLDVRDAWGTRLELFINDFMLGTLVVIRSNGIDGKPGTVDDQLAIRWKEGANLKLLDKAFDFGDERFRKLLV